jgi:hypothetical protein
MWRQDLKLLSNVYQKLWHPSSGRNGARPEKKKRVRFKPERSEFGRIVRIPLLQSQNSDRLKQCKLVTMASASNNFLTSLSQAFPNSLCMKIWS